MNGNKLRSMPNQQNVNTFPDSKPSAILETLQRKTRGKYSNKIIIDMLMEKLTPEMREILLLSNITDPKQLALQADKIYELGNRNDVKQFGTQLTDLSKEVDAMKACAGKIGQLESMCDHLRKDVDAMKVSFGKINQLENMSWSLGALQDSVNKIQTTLHNNNIEDDDDDDDDDDFDDSEDELTVCYYHMKFGQDAYQCRPPCVFEEEYNQRFDNYY